LGLGEGGSIPAKKYPRHRQVSTRKPTRKSTKLASK
jgi:hypothetical protein